MEVKTDILDKVKAAKNSDTDQVFMEKTKGTATSAMLGCSIGLAVGFARGYNLLFCAVAGASIAGIISHFIVHHKN